MNQKEILELILSRYVVIFGGRYSRGKSLSLTALNFFDLVFNGRNKLLSNMPVKFPVPHQVIPLIQTKIFDSLPDKINILYDEIHLDLNSRNSQNTINKYIGIFGRDIAKTDSRLRGSVQFFDTLEKVIGLLLEVTIIPEFVHKYSDNSKEDNRIRIEKKDFRMRWKIDDRREQNNYTLYLNLAPFIYMYNTKFKTLPLYVNHKEYVEKINKKKKERDFFDEQKEYEIELRLTNFEKGLKEIGKEMIR